MQRKWFQNNNADIKSNHKHYHVKIFFVAIFVYRKHPTKDV